MINNVQDLSNTITAVVNRALEVATDHSTTGAYVITYSDVADLIDEDDYHKYLDFITFELSSRAEVLDCFPDNDNLDLTCGYAWIKDYEPAMDEDVTQADYGYRDLLKEPSMARLAEIGKKAVDALVISGPNPVLNQTLLGISSQELEQLRGVTGWDMVHGELGDQTLPRSVVPKTSYEELLIAALQEKDAQAYSHGECADTPTRIPFIYCVNQAGQFNEELLANLPEERANLAQIFSSGSVSGAARSGALIHGRGVLILSYELNRLSLNSYPPKSESVRQAMAAMLAGQLDEIFLWRGLNVTYGLNTGIGRDNEVMAILPANATPELLQDFERAFAKAVIDLADSIDLDWVETQFSELRAQAEAFMASRPFTNPWTAASPDQVAIHCCEALGRYIGSFHDDWQQAKLTHNQAKLEQLSARFDVRKSPATLEKAVREGVYQADQTLSRHIRLYMDPQQQGGEAQSFIVPLGQLYLAKDQMGYSKDYPISDFLLTTARASARDIKALTDAMPRLPLHEQMRHAQQRKDRGNKDAPVREQDKDHEH